MAASSSSPPQDLALVSGPTAPQQTQPPPASTSSRRLPPPCWTPDETVALIDSYRDKWYALRRGNLKATHWQEVADAVCSRCPLASPSKTAVQCRHKMEKLRKRYRTEIQRARSMPSSRFSSSWVHFKRMDSMEKGPSTAAKTAADSGSDENEDEEDADEEDDDERITYQDSILKNVSTANSRSLYGLMGNGIGGRGGGGSGFRIRIPNGVSIAKPGTGFRTKNYGKFDHNPNPNLGTRVLREFSWARPGLGKRSVGDGGGGGGGGGVGKREREGNAVSEMVSALKVLGDGFVKMEQMKMEMAREIETMRMEMEMKRTEMILESQQRIVEAFANAVSEKKKKAKRMPSPES